MTNNDVIFLKMLNVGISQIFISEVVFQVEQLLFLHQNRSLITCSLRKMYFEVQMVVIF